MPEPGTDEALWLGAGPSYDRRYAQVRRPIVVTGGELTLDQLDLQYDPFTKLYQAPFQVKANGGVLIVDDFGRQRVPPRDLLNRWIVPLEKRIDLPDPAHRRQVPGAVRLPADLRHQPRPGASWSRRRSSAGSTTRSRWTTRPGRSTSEIFQPATASRWGSRIDPEAVAHDLPRLLRRRGSRRGAAIRAT